LGAAALAGLAVGVFASKDDVRAVWKQDKAFVPAMDTQAREQKLSTWKKAVARSAL
jgi:glycerol kinase